MIVLGSQLMVRTVNRRECLRLLLGANAALLGFLALGPGVPNPGVPPLSNCSVPIEGLGLGLRFAKYLRAVGITTIGKLMTWKDFVNRADQPEVAQILHLADEQITARLTSFVKFGPVPFVTLSRRETVMLDFVNRGYSQRQIARRFYLGGEVPGTYLRRAYAKMQGRWAPYSG